MKYASCDTILVVIATPYTCHRMTIYVNFTRKINENNTVMVNISTLLVIIAIALAIWGVSEGFNYLQDKFCDWIEKKFIRKEK